MLRKLALVTLLFASLAQAQRLDIPGEELLSGSADAKLKSLGRDAAQSSRKIVVNAPEYWHEMIAEQLRAGGADVEIELNDAFFEGVTVRIEDTGAETPPPPAEAPVAPVAPVAVPTPAPKPVAPVALPSTPKPVTAPAPTPKPVVAPPPQTTTVPTAQPAPVAPAPIPPVAPPTAPPPTSIPPATAPATTTAAPTPAPSAPVTAAPVAPAPSAPSPMTTPAATPSATPVPPPSAAPQPAPVATPQPPTAAPAPAPATATATATATAKPAADRTPAIRKRFQDQLNGGAEATGTLTAIDLEPTDLIYVDEPVRAVVRRSALRNVLYWLDGELNLLRVELNELGPNRYEVMERIRNVEDVALRTSRSATEKLFEAAAPAPGSAARQDMEKRYNGGKAINASIEPGKLTTEDILYLGTGVAVVVRRSGSRLERYWLAGKIDLGQSALLQDGARKYRVMSDNLE